MRKVILNDQNKFNGIIMSTIADNFVGNYVDADEATIKEIINNYNNEMNVHYDGLVDEFVYTVNVNAIKVRLRARRDKDLVASDKYMLVDVYNNLSAEEQVEITDYRADLRDYINLIVTAEDEHTVPYPTKPSFVK